MNLLSLRYKYLHQRHNKTVWNQSARLLPESGIIHLQFGRSVSITNRYALIGDYEDEDNGEMAGAAYLFQRTGDSWVQNVKLTASDGSAHDYLGQPVALTDNYAIAGALGDDENGRSSGSAYIFERRKDTWIETAKLTADDADIDDHFAYSVAITDRFAIVGAPGNDDAGERSGSAYIFENRQGAWIQTVKLTASDASTQDVFGGAVALTDNYALVAASGDCDNGQWAGAAYIYNLRDIQPPYGCGH